MKNTKSQRAPRGPAGMPFLPGGPIDWEAWTREAMQPRGMKGRKFSPEICAKFSEAQKLRFARKRAALAEAIARAKRAEDRAPKVEVYDPLAWVTVTDKVLGNMQPGSWYATLDMATVAGVKYQACKAFAVRWWKDGILQRRQNPAWKPVKPGHRQEPKWLYCLTRDGEARHRLAAALL